jgi:hypothetical protein
MFFPPLCKRKILFNPLDRGQKGQFGLIRLALIEQHLAPGKDDVPFFAHHELDGQAGHRVRLAELAVFDPESDHRT